MTEHESRIVLNICGVPFVLWSSMACPFECGEKLYGFMTENGAVVLQHGENPEHRREFERPSPYLHSAWLAEVHGR